MPESHQIDFHRQWLLLNSEDDNASFAFRLQILHTVYLNDTVYRLPPPSTMTNTHIIVPNAGKHALSVPILITFCCNSVQQI